ncbi:38025_t:CDS:1, partial [Gigaspora margarita]
DCSVPIINMSHESRNTFNAWIEKFKISTRNNSTMNSCNDFVSNEKEHIKETKIFGHA